MGIKRAKFIYSKIMKTTIKLLSALLLTMSSFLGYAYDFEYDGLYYNILSESDRTVEVTYQKLGGSSYMSGDIVIPQKVLDTSGTYTVTSIGESAFESCSGLTSVTIPNSVISIGNGAFYDCAGLKSINIDTENAYYTSVDGVLYNKDASNLLVCPEKKASVTIPNSVTTIEVAAFSHCDKLAAITIPNSVTSIGEYAFYSCTNLTSVKIGNSVSSIGVSSFRNCSRLTSVTIPNSVTSIGVSSFRNCSRLDSVTIPNSVTAIGDDAFSLCSSLKSINMQCEVPIECESSFPENVLKKAVLYVPTGTLSAYKKVDPWRNFLNVKEKNFSGVDGIEADGKL